MSLFKKTLKTKTGPTTGIVRSNILGVTGLSRASLAAMFRRNGLFGRDSALSPAEQAVLQSRLPVIEGLPARVAPAFMTLRLTAFADYAESLVARRDAARAQARLERLGLSEAAITEVRTVIENVFVVFAPKPQIDNVATWARAEPKRQFAKAA